MCRSIIYNSRLDWTGLTYSGTRESLTLKDPYSTNIHSNINIVPSVFITSNGFNQNSKNRKMTFLFVSDFRKMKPEMKPEIGNMILDPFS